MQGVAEGSVEQPTHGRICHMRTVCVTESWTREREADETRGLISGGSGPPSSASPRAPCLPAFPGLMNRRPEPSPDPRRASSVMPAASRNVAVKPSPTARAEASVISSVPSETAKKVVFTEAPVMKPGLRDRSSNPDITLRCFSPAPAITSVLFAARNDWKPGVRTISAATYPAMPSTLGRRARQIRQAVGVHQPPSRPRCRARRRHRTSALPDRHDQADVPTHRTLQALLSQILRGSVRDFGGWHSRKADSRSWRISAIASACSGRPLPAQSDGQHAGRRRREADDDRWHGEAPVHVVRALPAQATIQVKDDAEETHAPTRDRDPREGRAPLRSFRMPRRRQPGGWPTTL